MKTSLYFSPHLDDVVLCCAGRILQERAAGQRVIVATIFSEGGKLHPARREEDRRALAVLDAEAVYLGLLDAPFRNPYYSSFRTIILGSHGSDAADAVAVERCVQNLVNEVGPTCCYFPLAIGMHIDHRLTHAAAWKLTGETERVFYEDRPYLFLPHNVFLRFRELGIEASPPSESLIESMNAAAFLRGYLPKGPEWDWCAAEMQRRLEAPVAKRQAGWKAEVVTASNLERIVAAVACYQSQIADLFGTLAEYRRLVTSTYAERYWRAP